MTDPRLAYASSSYPQQQLQKTRLGRVQVRRLSRREEQPRVGWVGRPKHQRGAAKGSSPTPAAKAAAQAAAAKVAAIVAAAAEAAAAADAAVAAMVAEGTPV